MTRLTTDSEPQQTQQQQHHERQLLLPAPNSGSPGQQNDAGSAIDAPRVPISVRHATPTSTTRNVRAERTRDSPVSALATGVI